MPLEDDAILHNMAQQLLSAMTGEETVDAELLSTAENLITSHHFYIQLLFVSLIIERTKQLSEYFEAIDYFREEISVADTAEMTPAEKTRAIQALTSSAKTQLEIVNAMLASKEASGVLITSLRENFGDALSMERKGDVLDEFSGMTPSARQRILKGAVQAMREIARKEKNDA